MGGVQKLRRKGAERGLIVPLADLGADAPPFELDLLLIEDEGKEQLRKDPIQTVFVDLTKLGLVEITRKKTAASLAEKLGRSRKETLS